MKRVLLVLCGLALAGGMTGCQPSTHEEQRARLDDAIHEVEHELSAFYLLGPDASTSEIRAASGQLAAAWDGVVEAADGLEDTDVSKAAAAHQALVSAVEVLPMGDEDEQAVRNVMPKLDAFKSAIEALHGAGHFHE